MCRLVFEYYPIFQAGLVVNEVSDPILNTIHFLKVCTMTSFPINLIPIPGGGSGRDQMMSSVKGAEQQTPPRYIKMLKKR